MSIIDNKQSACSVPTTRPRTEGHLAVERIVVMLLLSGCLACELTPKGAYERTPVPEDKGVIDVYRDCDSLIGNGLISTIVKCADDRADLADGSYHRFNVEPGILDCSALAEEPTIWADYRWLVGPVQINVKPGHDYYIREHIESGLSFPGVVTLTQIDDNAAQIEIAHCIRDAVHREGTPPAP